MSVFTKLLALCAAPFAAACLHAAPASLDLSFGAGTGTAIVPIDSNGDVLSSMAIQPDGRILLGGYCVVAGSNNFCMARLLDNGTLDTSFGTGGKVTTAIGPNNNDRASAMALLPDGRIVLAGTCHNGNDFDICVARYLSNGSLDTQFNSTGKRVLPGDGTKNEYGRAVAVQNDSKIVIAGYRSETAEDNFLVIRLLADGSFDTSFNTSGSRSVNVIAGVNDQASAVAVAVDRSIVVAGTCTQTTQRFCVVRLTSTGATDTGFNGTGQLVLSQLAVGSNDQLNALAIQPDGYLVMAGQCTSGSVSSFCAVRTAADGTLDSNFNGSGKQVLGSLYTTEKVASVAIEAGGRIVLGGTCSNLSSSRLCVMRLNPDGTPDTSFNTSGRENYSIGPLITDELTAIAVRRDGRIVAAGSCFNGTNLDFCALAIEGGPLGYRNCSLDIDGDGQILATTDALIHARIALGMTGTAVVGGISFPTTATRTTWPIIRDYLISQCNVPLAR